MLEGPDIKQRLTAVVECLIDYKGLLIDKNTINITTPSDLKNIIPVFKEKCNIIKDFMLRHERPLTQDSALNACLDCIERALTPWDMDMSILCPEFCEKVFEGFNQNEDKIRIIKEIEFYCPVIDGVPDEEGSQE